MHQLQVSGVWCILSYWWDHSACWARAGAWACTVLLGIPLWCCPGLACTEHHTVAADHYGAAQDWPAQSITQLQLIKNYDMK